MMMMMTIIAYKYSIYTVCGTKIINLLWALRFKKVKNDSLKNAQAREVVRDASERRPRFRN